MQAKCGGILNSDAEKFREFGSANALLKKIQLNSKLDILALEGLCKVKR
jgi:hypothetical protein